jgi:hypothetical protein
MGSYKNVSTDHLCEEADNAPHRVLRLGNSSQSSVLLTKDSAGDMKNNPRTHARMKELQYFTTVALNAYIFVTTTLLSDSCPVDAESQALFAPVCELLEAVYSGDLAKLLEPGDAADTPGGIFTPQARQASEFMVEELLKARTLPPKPISFPLHFPFFYPPVLHFVPKSAPLLPRTVGTRTSGGHCGNYISRACQVLPGAVR